jgi:peroxiredoxin
MAQLRHDYQKFKNFNTEVLVIVPNGPKMIERHYNSNNPPYMILSDKGSKVAAQYFQVKHFLSLGTPTVFLVAKAGEILFTHYATSYLEEPDNNEPLAVLAQMNSHHQAG